MDKVLKVAAGGIGGALIGTIGLTAVALGAISLTPGVKNDGQSGMSIFLTVPCGAIAGFATGAYLVGAKVFEETN